MLSDTGFFCRNVLGMDTDRDEHGNAYSEIGKGGVRSWGPHQEVVSFLDDDARKAIVILAPRFSYKSSIVQGFILRNILAHPNIAILLYFHDDEMATKRCATIRDILVQNEIIRELFGNLRGPEWTQTAFTTSHRSDKTLQSPTLSVATPRKARTGGRYNLILFDDIVSETNYLTEEGLKKSIHCMQTSLALASRGARYIDVGTPYHPGDAHHWAMDSGWDKLTHLDVGCELVTKDDGTLDLEGEARWPNLPISHLRTYLQKGMKFQWFMSQFKLQVVAGLTEAFRRTHFQPCAWKEEHQDLTGYLLTDVAPSGSEKGDLNILMYVGIDEQHRVYILDIDMGHMLMYAFCDRYLKMLQKWGSKVNHRCELWEKGLTFPAYQEHLRVEARKRNVRIQMESQQRNQTVPTKRARIAALQARFQSHEIFVMDTVPRQWSAGTEMRTLWDPEGYTDHKHDVPLPAGDLVEQFVRFPHHMRDDLPDTLALVDSIDKHTQARICTWVRPSRQRIPEAVQRRSAKNDKRSIRGGSSTRFYERYGRR